MIPMAPPEEKKLPPLTQELIDALHAWCDEPGGYGRRSEVARALGVPRQAITHWLTGRQGPTAEQALALLRFLKQQRRRR
jgi:plasmid maintenance system antidote protein VapI